MLMALTCRLVKGDGDQDKLIHVILHLAGLLEEHAGSIITSFLLLVYAT